MGERRTAGAGFWKTHGHASWIYFEMIVRPIAGSSTVMTAAQSPTNWVRRFAESRRLRSPIREGLTEWGLAVLRPPA
jgi:hypothetical protein